MPGARISWVIFALCSALASAAYGQSVPTSRQNLVAPSLGTDELNGGVRWFQLEMPLLGLPLRITWNPVASPTYEVLGLSMYNLDARFWERGAFSVSLFNSVRPAIELDCLASVCRPMIERTFGLEGRINLGGRGIVPNNFLFIRPERVLGPMRGIPRFKLGIGGDLDL